jgi:hypothetical protein
MTPKSGCRFSDKILLRYEVDIADSPLVKQRDLRLSGVKVNGYNRGLP